MNINSIHQSCNNDNEEELQINNESYSLFLFLQRNTYNWPTLFSFWYTSYLL